MKRSILAFMITVVLFGASATGLSAVEVMITIESYPPAILPVVSTIVDVLDPSDQVEISRQASLLALSPDGWNLEQLYDAYLFFFHRPDWSGDMYSAYDLEPSASDVLGFELNPEAWQYGPGFALFFHTDSWVARGGHDICESQDNYGVISGIMGGYWFQCGVPDWGRYWMDEEFDCPDFDEDGYGYPTSSFCAFSEIDCDDSDPEIHPGADELCNNEIDDDCDGLVDIEDSECKEFTLDLMAYYWAPQLHMDFTIGTPLAAMWGNYLISIVPTIQVIPLWTIPLPIIDPPVRLPISFLFPEIGGFWIHSILYTVQGTQAYGLAWVYAG